MLPGRPLCRGGPPDGHSHHDLRGNNVFRTRRKLAAYIREGGYEIIHCHGSRANMIGAMLRKVTGLPVVTTVHSDYRLDYMGRPLSHLTFGTINALCPAAAGLPDRRVRRHGGPADLPWLPGGPVLHHL
ncbi:glycosyltransferase [Oscillibacter sp.]|uniref:glycosyltransferase n=1 Tax=Oscillibacter sp. TaxID=1945593 RepID=UPI00257B252E|nr:glycosyltransferase [Oscillibacter sp.]